MLLFQKYSRIASARIFCITINSSSSPDVHGKTLQDKEEHLLYQVMVVHICHQHQLLLLVSFWMLRSEGYLR